MLGSLEANEAEAFQATWDRLPETLQTTAYKFLAVDGAAFPAASEEQLREFSETDGAAELLASWGNDAPKKLGNLRGKLDLMANAMSPQDRKQFGAFLDDLTAAQAIAVFSALA